MSLIIKNVTASPIFIADVGISIPANDDYTVPPTDYLLWAASSDVITGVGSGDLVVNDGTIDLSISDGVDMIKGFFPKKIQITDGTNDAGVTAAGELKTTATITSPIQFTGAAYDAFGRFRVSNPKGIFDCSFIIDKQPLLFSELTTSSATVVHNNDTKSVVLTSSTTLNSKATFQSRQYIKYHPGKSQLVLLTGNLNGAVTNVRKRIGQFDAENGYFFQLSSSTLSVVLRSKVSGSVVDSSINQSSWNLDKLDGTGTSGHTIDIGKQQIFIIDYQWLGSGRVRFGFFINNQIVYCHEDFHANVIGTPYSQTADLPVRVECETLTGGATSSMWLTCCTVMSEGDWGPLGILRTANQTSAISFSSSSTKPIISLRKQSAYIRIPVSVVDFGVFASSTDDFLIKVFINPTLTGASWTNLNGICQVDNSATALSGGAEVFSYYLRGASGASSTSMIDILKESMNLILGSDLSGNSDIITVAAYNLTTTATAYGVINYKELI